MGKKPTKKDLEQEIKQLKEELDKLKHTKNYDKLRTKELEKEATNLRLKHQQLEEKNKDYRTAVDSWEAAHAKSQERVKELEDRILNLRLFMSKQLLGIQGRHKGEELTPEDSKRTLKNFYREFLSYLARLENVLPARLKDILPKPRILEMKEQRLEEENTLPEVIGRLTSVLNTVKEAATRQTQI